MKVFIGLTNIASQIPDLAKGFQALGHQTFTAINSSHANIVDSSEVDIDLSKENLNNELGRKLLFEKALNECDAFVFLWSCFFKDFSDLRILNRNSKKVCIYFVGNDVRWKPACDQEFKKYKFPLIEYQNYFRQNNTIEHKLKYLRNAEKYATSISSSPATSHLGLRPYFNAGTPINLNDFMENCDQRGKPLIIHTPSNQNFKGTKYVIEVIECLKSEKIEFDFKFLENIPYYEVKNWYSEADILIGQLLHPMGGKQEKEALACGTIVMSHTARNYHNVIQPDCPIVSVTPDTLYEELRSIIKNYELRKKIAKMGRPYVEKYYSNIVVAKKILDSLEDNFTPSFKPMFFRDNYTPESYCSAQICNKYTEIVKDCNWYKLIIKPGVRDGLIF
jgi:hypothetical protein